MGIILKENNLVYTKKQHSKFLGSSKYCFDKGLGRIYLKESKKTNTEKCLDDHICLELEDDSFIKERLLYGFKDNYSTNIESVEIKKEKRTTYILNKKKVREKCSAFFGLKKSRKFLAFYSISFPFGFPDDMCMKVFNTFLTRLRKDFRLRSYLWVAERQKNGTLHFHLLTNCFMPIRRVNYYMSKAINNQILSNNLSLSFTLEKYNGVDVRRVNNNRKALNIYLTKYISKNDILFYRLPYHSSRDISILFTAESFRSVDDPDFKHISEALKYIKTTIIDNEYATVEYLSVKQDNGKVFNPPDSWYWLRDHINNLLVDNFYNSNFSSFSIY